MSTRHKFESEKRIDWFKEVRFGMFIHWGLYSIPARGEWVMDVEKIPKEEYALLANRFSPKKFNADDWVRLAKEAGMKYVVLTTRHHDGFCLFDSKVSDFTSVKTAAKKDFVAEYVKACRKYKMKIGFYYSLLDWRFPGYYNKERYPESFKKMVEQAHLQVKELMSNYGKIDYLFYDGEWIPGVKLNRTMATGYETSPEIAKSWHSQELNRMVRKLQPRIIINNRSGVAEDVDSPEQNIVSSKKGRIWESCMTMNDNWGYSRGDKNWKSTRQLIMNLVRCVSGDGNFLLNVGPRPDGTIPATSVNRLKEIGKWMKINEESIYGCGKAPFGGGMVGLTTAKKNKVYLHLFRWPGKEICLAGVKNKIKSAHLLASNKKVSVSQKGERLFIKGLPEKSPDPIDTVIVLE
ncbi:MAG: hypothetical protein DDT40_01221 [candidate division WS2 bacterium]|nr:hypothetical protein [Candidatus Psychracetigena formicireducens]